MRSHGSIDPRAEDTVPALPLNPGGVSLQATPASPSLFVVEDDAPVRGLFVRALAGAGYRVYEARNGEEALEWLGAQGEQIDVLITDMRMPYVDGAELIAEVRRRRPAMRILGVSAYPPLEDAQCDAFLQKPFTNVELLTTVRELLTRS